MNPDTDTDDLSDLDLNDLDARQEEDSSVDEDEFLDENSDPSGDENLNDEDEGSNDDDAEGDEDGEADEEDEEDKTSHRNPKFEKRIRKEVARRKAAQAQLAATETELKTLRDQVKELQGSQGVYDSIEGVTQAKQRLRRELDEIEDAIDAGGFERPDGTTIEVSTLKKWRRSIRAELEDSLPAAERRLIRQQEVNREQVARVYPDLLTGTSPLAKEARRLFERIPGLKSDPEAFLMVGDLLRGRQLRAKLTGKAKTRKAPPESRSPSSASRSVRKPKPSGDELLSEISTFLDLP